MPKVPESDPQFSLGVPGVNMPRSQEFGAVGRATSQLGEEGAQAGMDIGTKLMAAQASNDSSNAYAQYRVDSEAKILELKTNSRDGFVYDDPNNPDSRKMMPDGKTPMTIADAFHDWANDQYQNYQSNMTNELGARMFRERTLPHISDQMTTMINDTHQLGVKSYDENLALRIKQQADSYSQAALLDRRGAKDYSLGPVGKDPNTGAPVYSNKLNPISKQQEVESFVHTEKLYDDARVNREDILQQVSTGLHNSNDAAALINKADQLTSRAQAKQIYDDIKYKKRALNDPSYRQDVLAAIDLTRGVDEQSKARMKAGLPVYTNMLDPIQKEAEISKLEGLLSQAGTEDTDNLRQMLKNTVSAQSSGEGDPRALNFLLGKIHAWGSSDPKHQVEAANMFGEVASAIVKGAHSGPGNATLSGAQLLAQKQKDADQAKAWVRAKAQEMGVNYDTDLGAIASAKIDSDALDEYNKIMDGRRTDPVAFLQQAHPEWNGRAETSHALLAGKIDYTDLSGLPLHGASKAYQAGAQEYKTLNRGSWSDQRMLNDRAYLSIPQSKALGQTLTNLNPKDGGLTDGEVAKGVRNLSAVWGNDFSRNLGQMIKDGNIPKSWVIVGNQSHADVRSLTYTMSCLRGGSDEDKAFKDQLVGMSGKEDALKKAVAGQTANFISANTLNDPDQSSKLHFALQLNDAVTTGAIKELRNGAANEDDAAKRAFQKLIGDFYWNQPVGHQRMFDRLQPASPDAFPKVWKGQVIGPQQHATRRENLNAWAASFDHLSIVPPPGENGQPGLQSDKFISKLKEWGVRPAIDPANGEYNLVYTPPSGYTAKVMTKDARGNIVPLSKSFDDLLKPRPMQTKDPKTENILQRWLPGLMKENSGKLP